MTLLFGITTEPHRAIFYSHAVQSSIAHSIDLFIPRFQQPPAKLRLATISFDAESLIQLATTIISGPANVGRRESQTSSNGRAIFPTSLVHLPFPLTLRFSVFLLWTLRRLLSHSTMSHGTWILRAIAYILS
jgi:hypothetical protein